LIFHAAIVRPAAGVRTLGHGFAEFMHDFASIGIILSPRNQISAIFADFAKHGAHNVCGRTEFLNGSR
jgi:hypothetical protein